MYQFINILLQKINRVVIFFVLIFGFQSQVKGQVHFDYISDWSNIFLSNINLITSETNSSTDKWYGSSIKNISFTSTLTFNDFYRERLGNLDRNLSYFHQFNTLKASLKLSNHIINIGAHYGISQKEVNFDLKESQSFHLKNGYKEYRFFLATSVLKNYLHFRGGLGRKILAGVDFYPWNVGIMFQPTESISLTYQRFEDLFRWEYRFRFENPDVLLTADEYSQLDEFKMQVKLISELIIDVSMQNNYINKDRTADNPGTILIPLGTHYQRNIFINIFPENILTANLYYYNRNHNTFGYFYDSFQKFGKLTEQKDYSESYQSELLYHTSSHVFGISCGW
jgi:hypothetical protein